MRTQELSSLLDAAAQARTALRARLEELVTVLASDASLRAEATRPALDALYETTESLEAQLTITLRDALSALHAEAGTPLAGLPALDDPRLDGGPGPLGQLLADLTRARGVVEGSRGEQELQRLAQRTAALEAWEVPDASAARTAVAAVDPARVRAGDPESLLELARAAESLRWTEQAFTLLVQFQRTGRLDPASSDALCAQQPAFARFLLQLHLGRRTLSEHVAAPAHADAEAAGDAELAAPAAAGSAAPPPARDAGQTAVLNGPVPRC